MNRFVNAIAGRLSLRHPQRTGLEILHRVTEIAPLTKDFDLATVREVIQSEFPSVTDFEREFPSLCFALATGVGKTRLMGAFVAYLHQAHGINNFFVLAPNLTIYNKLIADFSPNTPKYVFKGIADFAIQPPLIVTGDNYENLKVVRGSTLFESAVHINIFNIAKITSEVRGGKAPRIKRLSEYIGESYFAHLAGLPDLVLLMDESHRYRASAGLRAINELKPVLGLEFTATPFVETSKGAVPFKNVIQDYPLARAMEDGFVKEPAVVTRENFNPSGMSPQALETLKLEDGVRLHESVKVELETYARENNRPIVKPFLLVIARDTTHAAQLLEKVESSEFFKGHYKDKAIQVDSTRTGKAEEEMIEKLLGVENPESPVEIVIHVNMLKEGWDVTNLYTIVPLRAANARVLIEQSIGRGLRLPYGKRTGVASVDRLNIVAHDKFQEIIDEANRPESMIRLKQVVLDPEQLGEKTVTVVSQSQLANQLGVQPGHATDSTTMPSSNATPIFSDPEEQKVARIAYDVIRRLENQPEALPSVGHLSRPEIQARVAEEVASQYQGAQLELEGITTPPDIAAVVAKTVGLVIQQTIDIPRILVVPKGEVTSGFKPFNLAVGTLNYQPVSEDLLVQYLRTHERDVVTRRAGGNTEKRLEDYIVRGLVDFDDISYDDHADLLYDLAGQIVEHFRGYLSEADTRNVLLYYQKAISDFVHVQMQDHHWEEVAGYEVKVSKGFSELKPSAYTASAAKPVVSFREPPTNKNQIKKLLFGGFAKCLYPVQKFESNTERMLAVTLERNAQKWFRPASGQFQIYYKSGADQREYQPDFVAETDTVIYMLEPKKRDAMGDEDVLAKRDAAVKWCRHASDHAKTYGGKPWRYALIPHDAIAENMTLERLAGQFVVR